MIDTGKIRSTHVSVLRATMDNLRSATDEVEGALDEYDDAEESDDREDARESIGQYLEDLEDQIKAFQTYVKDKLEVRD